ncbi:MAG: hypothetical protein LIV24_09215 [Eubacterium sp.]|nr:hypothetical protein [Eubacterium sp.]
MATLAALPEVLLLLFVSVPEVLVAVTELLPDAPPVAGLLPQPVNAAVIVTAIAKAIISFTFLPNFIIYLSFPTVAPPLHKNKNGAGTVPDTYAFVDYAVMTLFRISD